MLIYYRTSAAHYVLKLLLLLQVYNIAVQNDKTLHG